MFIYSTDKEADYLTKKFLDEEICPDILSDSYIFIDDNNTAKVSDVLKWCEQMEENDLIIIDNFFHLKGDISQLHQHTAKIIIWTVPYAPRTI